MVDPSKSRWSIPTKSKTRVCRLTLALGSDLRAMVDAGIQAKEDEEGRRMLQREQMARATEISLLAGQGKHEKPHIHSVEHEKGFKFWVNDDDY
jgi:hypothetical protein